MTAPRWEVCRSIDGLFFARFIARNGRKVCVTETYTRKANAYKGIRTMAGAADPRVPTPPDTSVVVSGGWVPIVDLTVKP